MRKEHLKPWVVYLIERGWGRVILFLFTIIVGLPIFVLTTALQGAADGWADWKKEFAALRKIAQEEAK